MKKLELRQIIKEELQKLFEVEDKTTYELQINQTDIFLASKKGKSILIGDPNKKFVILKFDEFQKIVNFARKNGIAK